MRLPFILIPLAALVMVLPLAVHGCSCGHDFDFHLVNWFEASAQFKAGILHPAWAFSPAWNAGEPRFVFYPPISWTLGALLGLALPWAAVPGVYTGLALAAAGLAMYWLTRQLGAASTGALFAALVYIANHYMVFTAYERTAYAELLAAAWIPLLLAGILRDRVTTLRIAIPIALLWLTNAPAAVMGSYTLALLAVLRLGWMWKSQPLRASAQLAARVVGGMALGLGTAAFYILPAAYERRWVQIAMAMVQGMRIGDNFLFHHTGDVPHDEVLHTASVIALALLVAAVIVYAVVLAQTRHRPGIARYQAASLALVALMTAVLMTPVSALFWRFAPEMAFLQFPWRLSAVLAAVVCAGLALATPRLHLNRAILSVSALMLVAAIGWPSVHLFRQACDEEDTVPARLAVFNAGTGTDPTDEYTPGEADNDALEHANPPLWTGPDTDARPPLQTRPRGTPPMNFTLESDQPRVLVLNLRAYPAWQVRVNGTIMPQRLARADGLIAFPIPAGRAQVNLAYIATPDRSIGDAISLLSLGCAAALAGLARRRSRIIGSRWKPQ